MRRSHTPAPVLGLLLGIGILFLVGMLLIYGGQQRIAEELARVAEAQGLFPRKSLPPCPAPPKQQTQKIKRPQPTVTGSTIRFYPEPTQK